MIEAIINLIPPVLGLVLIVIWIISVANYDGKPCEPGDECDHCPFPCEAHEDKIKK